MNKLDIKKKFIKHIDTLQKTLNTKNTEQSSLNMSKKINEKLKEENNKLKKENELLIKNLTEITQVKKNKNQNKLIFNKNYKKKNSYSQINFNKNKHSFILKNKEKYNYEQKNNEIFFTDIVKNSKTKKNFDLLNSLDNKNSSNFNLKNNEVIYLIELINNNSYF